MLHLYKWFFAFCLSWGPLERSPVPKERGDAALLQKALKQPFTLLAKGGQTTVYASEDGRFVLKLFNNEPKRWIPFSGYRARKIKKLQRDMAAYVLAFDRLQEECALLFLHFDFQLPIEGMAVIDGKKIDLQKRPFVLQKKGISLQERLHKAGKRAVLEAVRKLAAQRTAQGISDHDPRLHQNIGFIDETPFFLDPGRFAVDPESTPLLPERFISWLESS